jgi:hypothetical protein
VSAALVAGSIVGLVFIRRITRGMIGRVVGALAALAVVYVAFLEGADRGFNDELVFTTPQRCICFSSSPGLRGCPGRIW